MFKHGGNHGSTLPRPPQGSSRGFPDPILTLSGPTQRVVAQLRRTTTTVLLAATTAPGTSGAAMTRAMATWYRLVRTRPSPTQVFCRYRQPGVSLASAFP